MKEHTLDTDALRQLHEEPRQLLDTIDNLRYLGVDAYVELPQIIVVGDQSAGKSSVLEAISRVKFPAKSGLCTRFATELVMRTASESKVEVRIIHPGRGSNDNTTHPSLDSFNKSNFGQTELAKIIEEAKAHVGLGPNGTGFSESVLRIQIQGPELPQLTLVDLPGFYHADTEEQTAEGRTVVEGLAAKYMAQKSSIILAVVTAKNEIPGQVVLRMAKQYDPLSERTMGIITKPDYLERNSSEEGKFLQLAKNEESSNRFGLGWHVLRNRNEAEAASSNDERDRKEAEFFESRVWRNLSSASRGIAELRTKLSKVLFDHVRQNLPEVIKGIEGNITERRQRLAGLGAARSTSSDHRMYLGSIAKRFNGLARDAVRGLYTDDAFFGRVENSDTGEERNPRKLRAYIRQLNRTFALVLVERGAARLIRMPDGTLHPAGLSNNLELLRPLIQLYQFDDPAQISWDAMKAEVERDAFRDQGTEFPGTMNPRIAFQQFKMQALPWNGIATRHVELVMEVTRQFVHELLGHLVPDAHTHERILAECVEPFFDEKRGLLASKIEELLEHYMGDYASQVDSEFLHRLSERVAKRPVNGRAKISEFDTEGVIDSMLTYYEMSLRIFTENVMVLAIENCLIRKVPDIFETGMVDKMDDEMLARLASETRVVRDEREMLEHDLEVLGRGLNECKRHRPSLPASFPSRPSLRPPNTYSVTPSVRVLKTSSPNSLAAGRGRGMFNDSATKSVTGNRVSRKAHAGSASTSSVVTLSPAPSQESSWRSSSPPQTPPPISTPNFGRPGSKSSKEANRLSEPGSTRIGSSQFGFGPRSPHFEFNEAGLFSTNQVAEEEEEL